MCASLHAVLDLQPVTVAWQCHQHLLLLSILLRRTTYTYIFGDSLARSAPGHVLSRCVAVQSMQDCSGSAQQRQGDIPSFFQGKCIVLHRDLYNRPESLTREDAGVSWAQAQTETTPCTPTNDRNIHDLRPGAKHLRNTTVTADLNSQKSPHSSAHHKKVQRN